MDERETVWSLRQAPDAERKADRRAFFRSIHGTLNHILLVDNMFLEHFSRGTPMYLPTGDGFSHFDELTRNRKATDANIHRWAHSASGQWLEKPATFTHHGDGFLRAVHQGFWVVHMFNHQAHHRGQITTLLTQLGWDVGSTDLHMSVLPEGDRAS